jgi:hypothetical protein
MSEFQKLCTGKTAGGTVRDINQLRGRMGNKMPLPPGYEENPEQYVQRQTVFRVPDDQVEDFRNSVVGELTDPTFEHGYQNYGLDKPLSKAEAEEFARTRIQGIGKSYSDLSSSRSKQTKTRIVH